MTKPTAHWLLESNLLRRYSLIFVKVLLILNLPDPCLLINCSQLKFRLTALATEHLTSWPLHDLTFLAKCLV